MGPPSDRQIIQPISGECHGECEEMCCIIPPDDQPVLDSPDQNISPKTAHIGAGARRPTYNVTPADSTPKMHVEFGIFNQSADQPGVILDGPEYNVNVNNNYLVKRRRRNIRERREETRVEITIQELNFTLECTQSVEHDSPSNNYTCKADISKNFNPATAVTLRFSVDTQYSVSLCEGGSKEHYCLVNQAEEDSARAPFKSTNNQKTLLDWNLKIGAYYKSEYKFRISVSEDPCSVDDTNPDPFTEYNISFQRQQCIKKQ